MTFGRLTIAFEMVAKNGVFFPLPVIGMVGWDGDEIGTGVGWLAWAVLFIWDRR